MVYYFKRFKATYIGTAIAFVTGCMVLAFVQFGVIQYIPKLASAFDILFTNNLGMPFDTGSIVFLTLVTAILVFLLLLAKKKKWYGLHIGVLCVMFIIIGYSSYFSAIIRSRADVPIDMTNPDNPISFLDYVDREQFGQQPLAYGPYFNSKYYDAEETGNLYAQYHRNGKDHYDIVGKKREPVFEDNQKHFFPRIYDYNEQGHINAYRNLLGLGPNDDPTDVDNLRYFVSYQMGWMWWRYFMWNFAGRQNDMEGQGDPMHANWCSGIAPVDKLMGLGDTDNMGNGYSTNGAHNKLYFLPFILGIFGLVYQFNKNKKVPGSTWVRCKTTGTLFFLSKSAHFHASAPPTITAFIPNCLAKATADIISFT